MNINKKKYIEQYIKIRNKSGKIVPLTLNQGQQRLYDVIKQQHSEQKPVRVIILKARQIGFSTLTESLIFTNTSTKHNIRSGIIAHKDDSTTNLFNMSKLMYEQLPQPLKPQQKASNAKEIIFDNDDGTGLKSKIRCMTAGADGIGRSDTFTNLHLSELAFWPGDKKKTMLGLMQAVPNLHGTMVIIESTPNGYEYFQELWERAVEGKSDYYPLFVGWNEMDDYKLPYDGFQLTDYEEKLKETYNLTNDQLTWRRWSIENNCGGDELQFRQEYPICPEEAFVASGNCVFNKENLIERLKVVNEPTSIGRFDFDYDGLSITNIRFVEDDKGPIKIWNHPVEDNYYVLGGDTAGEGSDFFVNQVINNQTGHQDAIYRLDTDETLYAHQTYCLGMYYNKALVGIETNFSTYPVKELQRLKYPNQFVRRKEDTYNGTFQESYGVKTTKSTRPLFVGHVVDVVREDCDSINDKTTLREGITFIKDNNGKPQAMEGKHDDTILALGIGHYLRGFQQVFTGHKNVNKPTFKWPSDLKQDYYKADKEIRERMIEKYGPIN